MNKGITKKAAHATVKITSIHTYKDQETEKNVGLVLNLAYILLKGIGVRMEKKYLKVLLV